MNTFDRGELGWRPELAEALEAHQTPARIAVEHRGQYVAYAEHGELRVRLPGRLRHDGTEIAVGDWVAVADDSVVPAGGGLVIDTPGLRELQLWDVDDEALEAAFADVEELAGNCRFSDCVHDREPGCAVRAALHAGELAHDRFDSWRKLQKELRAIAVRHDARVHKKEARKWRIHTREGRAKARQR